jgi:hypothetical protein
MMEARPMGAGPREEAAPAAQSGGEGTPYELVGDFFELCDCTTVCPCWIDLPPVDGRCTGAFGWSVRSGQIDGVDVAGQRVVSVSFHSGHRDSGGQEVYLFVDERADDRQFALLRDAFTGHLGGQLGELQTLLGVLRGVERTAIELVSEGAFMSITVDQRVSGDAEVLTGSDGEVTRLSHGRLSTVLGTTADVGTSSAFRVDLGAGFSVEVKGRAAMRGSFAYKHAGGG